jgi:hypothetical protein
MKQQTFKPQPVKRLGARMDYTLIEFLVGIVTIVGFMYKFERDTRSELRAELRTNIEELRSEMRRGFNRLANVITSANEITIEYLGLRGVLNQGDMGFLRTVIKGLASTATNPLTPEERRRLLELVDKDDLTIEEVEELYMLARKLYEEYIDKTPDAFKALLYAAAMRGITYRKYGLKPPNLSQA